MSVNKCMMQIPCYRQFTCCVFIRGRNSPLQSVRCCVVNSSASLMCHVSDCYQLVVVFYGGTQRVCSADVALCTNWLP